MTLITLDQMGTTMDDIRQSILDADGPEYGMTCGTYHTRRIYDWTRRCWRKVRIAQLGGKQPTAEPVTLLSDDIAVAMPDQQIVIVCEWLETVGPQTRDEIMAQFGVPNYFASHWASRHPDILTKVAIDNPEYHGPKFRYGAAEGWRDAYDQQREGATSQKLNDVTAAILQHIKDNPGVTRRELAQAFDMQPTNVRGRERTLVRYDLIQQEGSGSDTQSWPAKSDGE